MNLIKSVRARFENRRHEAAFRLLMTFRPGERHYGYDLARESGLRSGRTYPALTLLLEAGEVSDGWDDNGRRFYLLTDRGVREARGGAVAS